MKTKRDFRVTTLVVLPLVLGMLLFVAVSVSPLKKNSKYEFGASTNLIGASPAQVADYALEYVETTHQVRTGRPQVLMSESIQNADLPVLGLGCSLTIASGEDRPLMLVAMKGDLDALKGSLAPPPLTKQSYVVYLFDVLTGIPTATMGSFDGSNLRLLLHDPSLPTPGPHDSTSNCPDPSAKITPVQINKDSQISNHASVTTSVVAPAPVPTQIAPPQPIPTELSTK